MKSNDSNDYLIKSKIYKKYHYSVLSQEELRYLHNKTLEIFRVVIDVFNNNNIPYMICGGTLLGAVTSQNFIPWDDDIDLCVFEDDYDRAISCLRVNCPNDIIIQCKDTEPAYYHGWVKVRDKYSEVFPKEETYKSNGVWIDIYKLVRCKRKDAAYWINREYIYYLTRRLHGGGITKTEYWKRISCNKLIHKLLQSKIESTLLNKDDSVIYIIWSASKIILQENWILPLKKYDFEGLQVTSFFGAEKYLSSHYGSNYTFLPKDADRMIGIQRIEKI